MTLDDPNAQAAPPVVAVMVVHEPGSWFGETLSSLGAQDYPNLRTLFLLTGDQPEVRVGIEQRVPDAIVVSLGDDPGFGPAANEALKLVEGAGFFCFLHDDVALDRSAVSELVAETYRSNAGIVGPKLVDWDRPDVLQHVGLSADRLGVVLDACEPGEIDQEQHDAVRDVFSVPTACLLVRIDLFRALGGFAPDIDYYGDDLDLCWRAHLSGARVLVVPDARVRHRERLPERRPDLDPIALTERHGLRTSLSAPTVVHLVGLAVLHLFYFLTGAVVGLVTGQARRVRAMIGAGFWQLVRLPALVGRRRRFQATRAVSDAEVASLQGVRGSARLREYRRERAARRAGRTGRLSELGGDLRSQVGGEDARTNVVIWIVVIAVLVIGVRQLVLGSVPQDGELLAWPAGPSVLLREYLGGWWSQGLGGTRSIPSGMAWSALLGLVTFGADGLPRTLLVVTPLLIGAIGIWRLVRPIGSSQAAAAGLAVYVTAPLAANAVGTGSLSGLLAYGALPWVIHLLARIHAAPPYVGAAGMGPRARRLRRADVLVLAGITAAVGAFVPPFALVMLGAALALALGSVVVGDRAGSGRMVVEALVAAVIAGFLNLPWVFGLLPPAPAWTIFGTVPRDPQRLGLGSLAAFDFGPNKIAALSVVMALPLLVALVVARSHRFAWAGRAVVLGTAGLAVAWLADRGTLASSPLLIPLFLTPYAIALALGATCFVAAFQNDVRGTTLSWRQLAGVAAFAGLIIGVVPVLPALADGRFGLQGDRRAALLALLPAPPPGASSRVLWIGPPEQVPLPGWPLADKLVYALADDQSATLRERWREEPTSAESLIAQDLDLAASESTDRLGRLLGPMSVRFLLVPAPVAASTAAPASAPSIVDALDRQLDLRRVELGDDSLVAFENTAWIPVRAVATGATAAASRQAGPEALSRADLGATEPALPSPQPTTGAGSVPDNSSVLLSEAVDPGWQLTVGGRTESRRTAFGWATAWDVAAGGNASLRYRTSPSRYVLVALQVLLWIALLVLVRTWRHGPPLSRWRARRRVATSTTAAVLDLGASGPAGSQSAPVGVGGGASPDAAPTDWGGDA